MKRAKKLVIALIFLILLFSVTAFALGENDGYIVKLPETSGIKLMSLPDDAEYYGNGLYVVNTYEEAKVLSPYAEYIEPNHKVYLHSEYNYMSVAKNDYKINAVNILPMWNLGCYGDNIKVGVIDTGCNTHRLLDGAIEEGYNFLAEQSNGNPNDVTDEFFHGTMVSGIIAARYGDIRTIGMAHHAKIVPLKIFGNEGTTTDAILSSAIRYAADIGCKIINMSIGSPDYSKTMENAVNYVAEKGAIFIASVGNNAQGDDDPDNPNYLSYPAAFENVIGVGAVNSSRVRAPFSHYNKSVFVMAPGVNVRGTYFYNDSIVTGNGTSFSAPIVSGIVADMLSIDSSLTIDDVKEILINTCNRDVGFAEGETYNVEYGYGLIDAGAIAKYMLNEISNSVFINDETTEGFDDTAPFKEKGFTAFARMDNIEELNVENFGIYFLASDEEIDEEAVKTNGKVYKAQGKLDDGAYSVRLVNGKGNKDYFDKAHIGIISYMEVAGMTKFGILQLLK